LRLPFSGLLHSIDQLNLSYGYGPHHLLGGFVLNGHNPNNFVGRRHHSLLGVFDIPLNLRAFQHPVCPADCCLFALTRWPHCPV
jgi:hypothetical protein